MVRRMNGRPPWLLAFALFLARSRSRCRPLAQSTGMVKGVVKDDKGQPVDGAKVTIEMPAAPAATSKRRPTRRASSCRSACSPVAYKVTAEKDKLGRRPPTVNVAGRLAGRREARRSAAAGAGGDQGSAGEERRRMKKVFDEGVAAEPAPASTTRRSPKFNEAIAAQPELLRLLLQHRLQLLAEEGLRQRRSHLQESDRS